MTWFKMMREDGADTAKIEIFGEIGRSWYAEGGVDLEEFNSQLNALADVSEIDVPVSSGGGSYVVGAAIYNLLSSHPAKIITRILGEASSAASLIFLAGDERHAPENCIGLIHDPIMPVCGGYKSDELRKTADDQDTVKRAAMSIYTSVTGMSDDDVAAMMSADTILTGADMKENGFATHLTGAMEIAADAGKAVASVEMMRMKTENSILSSRVDAMVDKISSQATEIEALKKEPEIASADDVIEMCESAGFMMSAASMIKRKMTPCRVKSEIAEMKAVNDFCAAIKIDSGPVMAAVGKPAIEMAKVAVAEALAAADVDIQNHQIDDDGRGDKTPVVDMKKIYQDINRNKIVGR